MVFITGVRTKKVQPEQALKPVNGQSQPPKEAVADEFSSLLEKIAGAVKNTQQEVGFLSELSNIASSPKLFMKSADKAISRTDNSSVQSQDAGAKVDQSDSDVAEAATKNESNSDSKDQSDERNATESANSDSKDTTEKGQSDAVQVSVARAAQGEDSRAKVEDNKKCEQSNVDTESEPPSVESDSGKLLPESGAPVAAVQGDAKGKVVATDSKNKTANQSASADATAAASAQSDTTENSDAQSEVKKDGEDGATSIKEVDLNQGMPQFFSAPKNSKQDSNQSSQMIDEQIGEVLRAALREVNNSAQAIKGSVEQALSKNVDIKIGATSGTSNASQPFDTASTTARRSLNSSVSDEARAKPLPKALASQTYERIENVLKEVAKSKDGKTISLRLDPPDLGSVKVDVTLRDGSLHARLVAESSQVNLLLREKAPELQMMLRKLGLNVDSVSVSVVADESRANMSGSKEQKGKSGGGSTQDSMNEGGVVPGAVVPGTIGEPTIALDHWVA